jgi:hypothetical protein
MQQSKILSLFAVCVVLAFASVAFASGDGGSSSATAPLATTASTSALIAQPESRANMVASGIAQITGLAISPLIVLVAIGWADFFGLGGSNATQLPLHANPWFLVPCSIVLTLALLKKIASPAIPLPVRKLLDACEYFEAKLSALVAAGVLLPTLISTMAAATGAPDPTGTQTAAFFSGTAAYVVLVPVALLIFGSVWITFHVIDALIVLSPFAIVDTMLVALRGAILGVLGLAFLVSPYLALAFAIPLIVLSFLLAGWCVRLDLFALCVATDLLFGRDGDLAQPRAFLARRGLGAPIRTMGHAEPCEAGIRFSYRPLFILPRRTLEVPVERAALVHGLLWPTLTDGLKQRSVVAFPPRYGRHVDQLAQRFHAEVRDGRLRGGLRRVRQMFASLVAMLRGESAPAV